MNNDSKLAQALERAVERERAARIEAERFLESKSTELYESNMRLLEAREALEQKVQDRTADLERTVEELHTAAKERKEAVAELRTARDEALALMNERTDFFARISHDLRTPLNAIVGLTRLLQTENLESHQLKKIETIDQSSRVLLSMINEILDFTKIDAGEVELNVVPTDIVEVVNGAIDMLSEEARRKGIAIYLRSRSGIPSPLMLEPTRIGQVLINLLSNAVKFTHEGSVTVDIDFSDGSNSAVILRVIDTGTGIDSDRLETVFLPFKQSEEGQQVSAGGTGLGLAIVDRLVKMLNGNISIESTLGEGSTFEVSIPVGSTAATQQGDSTPLPRKNLSRTPNPQQELEQWHNMGHAHPLRILVADDNQVNREVLEMHLNYLAYEADYVANGEEAIRATIERNYDVVLMDISMPVVNGEEACRAIRALDDISQPYIVAVTASAMQGDRERYLNAGMDHYIAKPLEPTTLAKLLSEIKRSSKVRAPLTTAPQKANQHATDVLVDMDELNVRLGKMVKPMLLRTGPVFLAELDPRLDSIAIAHRAKDQEELTRLLHALKGSSSSTGCAALATLCSDAEALTRAGHSLKKDQIDSLLSCAKATGVALQAHIEAARK